MKMFTTIRNSVTVNNAICKKDRVVVALSGGPDSVALLFSLHKLSYEYVLKLYIAHMNHGLRGKEAERDEKFCVEIGKKLNIPVFIKRVNIKKIKKNNPGKSIEEVARSERYKFLEKIAKKTGASKIATGHTADDQVETFLMRFIRGAGTKGLAGIPTERDLESGIKIIRPIIDIWKGDILKFLKENKIGFVEDSTNVKYDFLRNRIRHELIPVLLKYNPKIKRIIRTTVKNLSLVNEYLENAVEHEFAKINGKNILNCRRLCSYHPAVGKLLVRRIVREIDKDVNLEDEVVSRILLIAGSANGSKEIDLPKGICVRRVYDKLTFSKQCKNGAKKGYVMDLALNGVREIKKHNIIIASALRRHNGRKTYKVIKSTGNYSDMFRKKGLSFEAELDYDTMDYSPVVRSRAPGDKIRPIGMRGEKKVQDVFVDAKVPKAYRDIVPIVCSGDEICWVAGYRIGERFKVTKNTKRILHIKVTID